MSRRGTATNVAASVRARLLDLSRQRRTEFQLVLAEFAIERLLYRLSVSPFADRFVLKGAMLFKLWTGDARRATWDLDLLGRGSGSVEDTANFFRTLCRMGGEDGIVFDVDSVRGEDIRATDEYAGVRIRLEARLDEARIPMQVDIGFGDVIVPPAQEATYPTLLGHAAPRILTYPREVAIAEKCEAMVSLAVTNSRMKDFYDVYQLASLFEFDGTVLSKAIGATFDRRGTPRPITEPVVWSAEFLAAPERQAQWRAFLRRGRLTAPPDAAEIALVLREFLGPVMSAVAKGKEFAAIWPARGPWLPLESGGGLGS